MKTLLFLKRWELALIAGLIAAVIAGGFLGGEQARLSEKILRLHVLANSDSAADQELKRCVRDSVLRKTEELMNEAAGKAEAVQTLEQGISEIERAALEEVRKYGYEYGVKAEIMPMFFDTRRYEGFSLPAGSYDALRVSIGEGKGKNWWCVVFPPLCYGTAVEEVSHSAAGLTEDEVALITEQSEGYIIKFRSIELVEGLINTLRTKW